MRFSKLEKLALDHPYFDCKVHCMPPKEAELVFNSGFPSFEEMIEGAKIRFNLSIDAWHDFDVAIATRAARQKKGTQRRTGLLNFILTHKRLSATLLIVILSISFFSFTSLGRALAKSFFDMISQVVGNRVVIQNQDSFYNDHGYYNLTAIQYDTSSDMTTDADKPIYYSNVKMFVEETGIIPVTLGADWLLCQAIQGRFDEDLGVSLTIQYITSDGLLVNVTQLWGVDENISFQAEGADYEKAFIMGNKELYYTTDPVDGSFNGTALLENSILVIGAENGVDISLLLKALEQ